MPTLEVFRWAEQSHRERQHRRAYEGLGWYVGLALFKALLLVTFVLFVASLFA